MTLNDFITRWNGKKADFDGAYGDQCVDLYDFYCRDVINCPIIYVNGAADIWENYPKDYFTRIPNEATNMPVPGDIMIWNRNYGAWGHVAIVTEANINSFKALSQNDPTGTPIQIKQYSYNNVFGWLHPKTAVTSSDTTMTDLERKKLVQFDRACIELNKAGYAPTPASEYWFENAADPDKFTNQIRQICIDAKANTDVATKLAECEAKCQSQLEEIKKKILALLNTL